MKTKVEKFINNKKFNLEEDSAARKSYVNDLGLKLEVFYQEDGSISTISLLGGKDKDGIYHYTRTMSDNNFSYIADSYDNYINSLLASAVGGILDAQMCDRLIEAGACVTFDAVKKACETAYLGLSLEYIFEVIRRDPDNIFLNPFKAFSEEQKDELYETAVTSFLTDAPDYTYDDLANYHPSEFWNLCEKLGNKYEEYAEHFQNEVLQKSSALARDKIKSDKSIFSAQELKSIIKSFDSVPDVSDINYSGTVYYTFFGELEPSISSKLFGLPEGWIRTRSTSEENYDRVVCELETKSNRNEISYRMWLSDGADTSLEYPKSLLLNEEIPDVIRNTLKFIVKGNKFYHLEVADLKVYFSEKAGLIISDSIADEMFYRFEEQGLPLVKDKYGNLWQLPVNDEEKDDYTVMLSPEGIINQVLCWDEDEINSLHSGVDNKEIEKIQNFINELEKLQEECKHSVSDNVIKEKIMETKNEQYQYHTVTLDLLSFYKLYGEKDLEDGSHLRATIDGEYHKHDNPYLDLFNSHGQMVGCDGEELIITSVSDDFDLEKGTGKITLWNNNNESGYIQEGLLELSANEFNIISKKTISTDINMSYKYDYIKALVEDSALGIPEIGETKNISSISNVDEKRNVNRYATLTFTDELASALGLPIRDEKSGNTINYNLVADYEMESKSDFVSFKSISGNDYPYYHFDRCISDGIFEHEVILEPLAASELINNPFILNILINTMDEKVAKLKNSEFNLFKARGDTENYENILMNMDSVYLEDLPQEEIEFLWEKLGNEPFEELEDGQLVLDDDFFLGFERGTDRETIWHWFDKVHPEGVAYLLNDYTPSFLRENKNQTETKQKTYTNKIIEKIKAAGIEVVSDKDEFDRILEKEKSLQLMIENEISNEKLFETNNNENLNTEIDALTINDINLQDEFINISEKTPFIYKEMGLDEFPVNMYKQKLARALFLERENFGERRTHGHKNEFSDKEVKEVLKVLGNPRYIFNSTKNINVPDDFYLIGVYDQFDYDNNPMMISFHYEKNKKEIEANWVTAIYGRKKIDIMKKWVEKGWLLYINDLDIEKAPTNVGTLYMRVIHNASAYINNITKKSDIVNNTGIMYMKENNNTYGFVHNGKIYLNPELMNPNATVHEYTHLWDAYTQKTNPELWNKGLELFKNTEYWNEVISDPNYQNIKDDDNLVLSEIHSRICGDIAEKVLNRIAELDGEQVKLDAIEWNEETWNYICEVLLHENKKINYESGLKSKDLKEFLSTPLKDLIEERKIGMNNMNKNQNIKFVDIVDGYSDDYSRSYRFFIHLEQNDTELKNKLNIKNDTEIWFNDKCDVNLVVDLNEKSTSTVGIVDNVYLRIDDGHKKEEFLTERDIKLEESLKNELCKILVPMMQEKIEEKYRFENDVEKMRDFFQLSKEDFLESYSYLTEEEYEATKRYVVSNVGKKQTKDMNNISFEGIFNLKAKSVSDYESDTMILDSGDHIERDGDHVHYDLYDCNDELVCMDAVPVKFVAEINEFTYFEANGQIFALSAEEIEASRRFLLTKEFTDEFYNLTISGGYCEELLAQGADPKNALYPAAEDAFLGDNLRWLIEHISPKKWEEIRADREYCKEVFNAAKDNIMNDYEFTVSPMLELAEKIDMLPEAVDYCKKLERTYGEEYEQAAVLKDSYGFYDLKNKVKNQLEICQELFNGLKTVEDARKLENVIDFISDGIRLKIEIGCDAANGGTGCYDSVLDNVKPEEIKWFRIEATDNLGYIYYNPKEEKIYNFDIYPDDSPDAILEDVTPENYSDKLTLEVFNDFMEENVPSQKIKDSNPQKQFSILPVDLTDFGTKLKNFSNVQKMNGKDYTIKSFISDVSNVAKSENTDKYFSVAKAVIQFVKLTDEKLFNSLNNHLVDTVTKNFDCQTKKDFEKNLKNYLKKEIEKETSVNQSRSD